MERSVSMIGKTFGKLTVLKRIKNNRHGQPMFRLSCRCGNIINAARYHLRSGHTKSCGCLQREVAEAFSLKHGHARPGAKTPEYRAWIDMLDRCRREGGKNYADYVGSFENFFSDMGKRPCGLTLERIDNSKGYSPRNCKWATRREQMRNTRRSVLITHNGKTKNLKDWAMDLAICRTTLRHRMQVQKLSFAEAISRPHKHIRTRS